MLGFFTIVTLTGCIQDTTTQSEEENQISKITNKVITEEGIKEAKQKWADGLVSIGTAYQEGNDYKEKASKMIDDRYGFQEGIVLFKPTKTKEENFRLTKEDALSYFVGGSHEEDEGFALAPWSNVRFENEATIIDSDGVLKIQLQHSSLPFDSN